MPFISALKMILYSAQSPPFRALKPFFIILSVRLVSSPRLTCSKSSSTGDSSCHWPFVPACFSSSARFSKPSFRPSYFKKVPMHWLKHPTSRARSLSNFMNSLSPCVRPFLLLQARLLLAVCSGPIQLASQRSAWSKPSSAVVKCCCNASMASSAIVVQRCLPNDSTRSIRKPNQLRYHDK